MGVPVQDMDPGELASTEALLSSLRTIAAAERRKHATAFSYWLSIRRGHQIPPIRDLDPLEISDAGPFSVLLEIVDGGADAEIRHVGEGIHIGQAAEKISESPSPSLLSCIASQLPSVLASRMGFAFEDAFKTVDGETRCWVTLLPFSATGSSVDFVYGFVSLDEGLREAKVPSDSPEPTMNADPVSVKTEESARSEPCEVPFAPLDSASESEPALDHEVDVVNAEQDTVLELVPEAELETKAVQSPSLGASANDPGFSSEFVADLANVGFHGIAVSVEPLRLASVCEDSDEVTVESDEAATQAADHSVEAECSNKLPAEEASAPNSPSGEILQNKLVRARAKADEARLAKLRANAALYEGLSAAYDFALDADENAEEYLKLVEAKGLKIQLRSPMKPVAKLTFDGMCDDTTIEQLEALLAWAFSEEIPRGMLAERIEAEGGIGPILSGQARAD